MIENKDYQLIPHEDDTWQVRLLSGDFVETVIEFGVLKIVDENLHYDFKVVYAPSDYINEENIDLQKHVGVVLYHLLEDNQD